MARMFRLTPSNLFTHNFDIVYGPIMNDTIGFQMREFRKRNFSLREFLEGIKYSRGETFQYAFCTERAIQQHYTTAYYNLDVILSVGYRVKSNRGIQFRRWSNTILKQYLLQGYSINRHLVAHTFSRLLMDKGIIMRSVINLSSVRTVR